MKRTLEMKRRRKPTDALLSGSPGTVKNKKKITIGRWLNKMRVMKPEILHAWNDEDCFKVRHTCKSGFYFGHDEFSELNSIN